MTKNTIETIGCDLGDKTSAMCILRQNGAIERAQVRTTPVGMRAFFERPRASVVIEVGTHSRWVCALLRELGHEVTVANARRVKAISENDSKSDKNDAELLARLGRVDVKLLAPITHRSTEVQADLAVAKSRDVLVNSRTKLVNHVRGVVKSAGAQLPRCTAESFHKKTPELIPPELKTALGPVYQVLESLDENIRGLDKTIERIAKKYPDVEIISQPNGVGILTALVYVLTIEDKNRFQKSRMVGSFLGLRPRMDQSGDGDPQLGITKAGDHFLRRLLVNAANHIMGPFGKDSDLRRWGLKLAERGGKNARKRAKVAVARKLAVLMHRLWMTGEVYEPLGYAEKNQKPQQQVQPKSKQLKENEQKRNPRRAA